MQPRVSVLFHGMPRSEAVEAATARWIERLGNICDRIQHCTVRIDRPHQHDHTSHFQIGLEIAIPGDEIVVSHHGAETDIYVALAEAFTTARRRLIDRLHIRRGA